MKHPYRSTLFACYFGYITQAIVNNLAPILFILFQNEFGISFEKIGRLILINFGTQIAADYLTARYADRIGYRRAAVGAHVLCAVGLILLGVLPKVMPSPYTGLVIAVMVYAVGGGIIEVLISPIVDSLPGEEKASAMSLLHSFYCWGQLGVVLITTALIKLFGTEFWFVLPVAWAAIPAYNLFRFRKVPLMPTVSEEERTPLKRLFRSRHFLLALIMMMCAGSSELTMSQWSSLFAEKGLGVPKLVGDILGPGLFAALMGIGRTIYGVLGHRLPLRKALIASSTLCVLCYSVTIFVRVPVIALLGCALCGFSVSLMWPGTFSMTSEAYPKGGTVMFGLLAIFGDLGASVGPWLAGAVSDMAKASKQLVGIGSQYGLQPDQLGLKTGLFAAILFPLLLLVCVTAIGKARKLKEGI